MAEREERHKLKEAAKQAAKAKIVAELKDKAGDTAVQEAGETEAGPNDEREKSPSVKSSKSHPR